MKFITYIESTSEFIKLNSLLKSHSIENDFVEVIVSFRGLSRFSENKKQDLMDLIALNQNFKLNLVLEWDLLSQENHFLRCVGEIKDLPLHEFKAIRLQDPGAINFIKENYEWLKIQLILENGNHNLEGLKRWSDFLGNQLDRLVLSNELSRDHLAKYAESKLKIEVLVFGRILLFYSPRLLLSPLDANQIEKVQKDKNLEAFGTSEESPHAGFPIIENNHGTFMFNVKDLSLIEQVQELKALSIEAVRFDLRFDGSIQHLEDFLVHTLVHEKNHLNQEIKVHHPRPLIKGFYNINKSDVLFPKLKNKRIERHDQNYLGEIVDVERDEQLILINKSKSHVLKMGDEIRLVTPEGKVKVLAIKELKSSSKVALQEVGPEELCTIPYASGIVAKTQVYLEQKK